MYVLMSGLKLEFFSFPVYQYYEKKLFIKIKFIHTNSFPESHLPHKKHFKISI